MQEIPIFDRNSKEDLRKLLFDTREELEKMELNSKSFSVQSKINTFFLLLTLSVAFLYPIIYVDFNKFSYIFFWASFFFTFIIRVKLTSRIIAREMTIASLKIVENAVEADLEKIRREEYDNLTRQITTSKDSTEV